MLFYRSDQGFFEFARKEMSTSTSQEHHLLQEIFLEIRIFRDIYLYYFVLKSMFSFDDRISPKRKRLRL
jgi:hypothetical protein